MASAKGKIPSPLIIVVLVVAYAAALVIGTGRDTTTWLALLFAVPQASILAVSLSRREPDTEGLFRAYPKLATAMICLVVQMVVGLTICLIAPNNIAILTIVGVLLLAICCACAISSGKAMDYANKAEQNVSNETDAMSEALLRLKRLSIAVGTSSESGRLLNAVIEKVRFADQQSASAVVELDAMISSQISAIETDGRLETDRLRELSRLIDERSLVLKGSK